MSQPEGQSCSNCAFAFTSARPGVANECRRLCPISISPVDSRWPAVATTDWCGEWADSHRNGLQPVAVDDSTPVEVNVVQSVPVPLT